MNSSSISEGKSWNPELRFLAMPQLTGENVKYVKCTAAGAYPTQTWKLAVWLTPFPKKIASRSDLFFLGKCLLKTAHCSGQWKDPPERQELHVQHCFNIMHLHQGVWPTTSQKGEEVLYTATRTREWINLLCFLLGCQQIQLTSISETKLHPWLGKSQFLGWKIQKTSTVLQRKGEVPPTVTSRDNHHMITWYCHVTGGSDQRGGVQPRGGQPCVGGGQPCGGGSAQRGGGQPCGRWWGGPRTWWHVHDSIRPSRLRRIRPKNVRIGTCLGTFHSKKKWMHKTSTDICSSHWMLHVLGFATLPKRNANEVCILRREW